MLKTTSFMPVVLLCGLIACSGCRHFSASAKSERELRSLESGTPEERVNTLLRIREEPQQAQRQVLEEILASDRNALARALAAEALGNLRDTRSVDRLHYAVRRDTDPMVREKALIALAGIDPRTAEVSLVHTLNNDREPLLRITALDLSIITMERREKFNILLDALRDESEAVRLVAYDHLKTLTGLDIAPDDHARWRLRLQQLGHL